MRAQGFFPAKVGINTVPRHSVPKPTEDIVCSPVLAAVGKGPRQKQPGDIATVLSGAEQSVNGLYRAGVLDPQLRKMDKRLPAIFVEFGPTADPAKLAQF